MFAIIGIVVLMVCVFGGFIIAGGSSTIAHNTPRISSPGSPVGTIAA